MPAKGGCRVRKGRSVAAVFAALLCALIGFAALPALAMATSSVVNSTADEPDETTGSGPCETEAGKCTLRAAVETANSDAGADVITFDPTVFEGVPGSDEIHLSLPLPLIEHPVAIRGGHCGTPPDFEPCAGVVGTSGGMIFTVEADDVEISGLALYKGTSGIEVDEAAGFVATGDRLGIKLGGAEGSFAKADLILGPGADEATIGSAANVAENRNVMGGLADFGILLRGASKAKIQGNYIGVGPDGQTLAPIETGVEIVGEGGLTPDAAEEDEVGGVLTEAQAASEECDGACNVIAGSRHGVDLSGQAGEETEPAAGPTVVRGNYIGLGAAGLVPVYSGVLMETGVWAFPNGVGGVGPGHLTVGGLLRTETNFIAGVDAGIVAGRAERFRAFGNAIGTNAKEELLPSPEVGISVHSEGVTEAAEIIANRLTFGPDGEGIVNNGVGARIGGNVIDGTHTGIAVERDDEGKGNLIFGNAVVRPDVEGILIRNENDANAVTGNFIAEAGRYGIVIENGAVGNRIGGDLPLEENVLEQIGVGTEPDEAGAITITGEPTDFNEVRGNHGAGNTSPFIQLFAHGPEEETPNGRIKPPGLTTVMQSGASGTAEPGATVRVFTKATTDLGELQPEIALATADASGHWTATYAKQPLGTLVATTQTLGGGTSEVSAPPVTAAADPPEPEKKTEASQPPSSSTTPPPPVIPPAKIAPAVKITKGPAKSSKSTKATFRFTASEPGAKFECKLDGKKWAACRSPKTYKGLKPGRHTFKVRATASGLTGVATVFRFAVKT